MHRGPLGVLCYSDREPIGGANEDQVTDPFDDLDSIDLFDSDDPAAAQEIAALHQLEED